MLILTAVICVAVAVGIAVWHLFSPKGVSVTEEFKAHYAPDHYNRRLMYVAIGGLVCGMSTYGITGQWHLAGIALFGGFLVAKFLENRRNKARMELLRSQYAQALSILVSALQGGLSPYQALEDAVPGMPRPAQDVFAEILRRTRTGSTFVQAAESVAKESGWADLKSLVVALKIYSQTGCNLVDVFQHLLETVHERENDRRYVAAVTAETRTTAMILSALPFFLMGVSRIMAPVFTEPLFNTLGGNIVIGICVLMVLTGNYIVGKMGGKIADV